MPRCTTCHPPKRVPQRYADSHADMHRRFGKRIRRRMSKTEARRRRTPQRQANLDYQRAVHQTKRRRGPVFLGANGRTYPTR